MKTRLSSRICGPWCARHTDALVAAAWSRFVQTHSPAEVDLIEFVLEIRGLQIEDFIHCWLRTRDFRLSIHALWRHQAITSLRTLNYDEL